MTLNFDQVKQRPGQLIVLFLIDIFSKKRILMKVKNECFDLKKVENRFYC